MCYGHIPKTPRGALLLLLLLLITNMNTTVNKCFMRHTHGILSDVPTAVSANQHPGPKLPDLLLHKS